MTSVSTQTLGAPGGPAPQGLPPLESGDHLGAFEFLRRYEAMPEVKKAELINGIVFMTSPVRIDRHAEPDNLVQTWLGTYAISTPGVRAAANGTVRLGPDDVPQPDAFLRIVPECGGQAKLDSKGYLMGAPELVVEVAASSASLDVREKLSSYRRAGVREYIVWRTEDAAIDWWLLVNDEYQPVVADASGNLRSRLFPGLWLDVKGLLAAAGSRVMDRLREGLASEEHAAFVLALRQRAGAGGPAFDGGH
jgi:Uma2 family endonuclease